MSVDGFPALASIGEDLQVANCGRLETVDFPALSAVGGEVSLNIYSNAVLCSAQVDALVAQLTSGPTLVNSSDNSGACP